MTQILVYMDSVIVNSKSISNIKESFLKLDKDACKVGLHIHEGKLRKYIDSSSSIEGERHLQQQQRYVFADYCFGAATSFQYVGSSINKDRN